MTALLIAFCVLIVGAIALSVLSWAVYFVNEWWEGLDNTAQFWIQAACAACFCIGLAFAFNWLVNLTDKLSQIGR